MILDSSAVIAILQNEPEAESFSRKIAAARHRRIGAGNLLEVYLVARTRWGEEALPIVRAWVELVEPVIVPFDEELLALAIEGHRRYGGGRRGLNFGDCMAYALAKRTGEPLLFKGADFVQTDIRKA